MNDGSHPHSPPTPFGPPSGPPLWASPLGPVIFPAVLSPFETTAFSCITEKPLYAYFLCDVLGYIPISLLVIAGIYANGLIHKKREKKWPLSAGIIFVTVGSLMYPHIIVACISILSCDTLAFQTFTFQTFSEETKNETLYYHLVYDRGVDCSDPTYLGFRQGAWAVGAIIGFATPLAMMLYGSFFSTEIFHYLTTGLEPHAWYWEILAMFRKAAVLAIVTVIPESSQLIVFTVLNYFFLMLTLIIRPYSGSPLYNVLECYGTSSMVVGALLLSLLGNFSGHYGSPASLVFSILLSLAVIVSLLTCVVISVILLMKAKENDAFEKAEKMPVELPPDGVEAEKNVEVLFPPREMEVVKDETKERREDSHAVPFKDFQAQLK